MNCDKCQATFGSRDYLAMHMLDHVRRESEAGELYAKASGAGVVSAAAVLSTAALAATEAAALFGRSGAGSYVTASAGALPDRDALAMRLLCRVYRSSDVAATAAAAAGSGGLLAQPGGETRSSPAAPPGSRNNDGEDDENSHLRVPDEEDKPLVAYDARGTPREQAGATTARLARPPVPDAADDDSDCAMSSGGGSAQGNACHAVDLTMPAHRHERSATPAEAVARRGDSAAMTLASDRRSVRTVAQHGLAAAAVAAQAAASAAGPAPAVAWPADSLLSSADKACFGRLRYSPYAGAASAAVAATAAYRWHFQRLAAAARLRAAAAAASISTRAAAASVTAPSLSREQRLVKVEPRQQPQHEPQPLVACRAGGVAELPPTSPAAEAEAASSAAQSRPALPAVSASLSPPPHASLPAPSLWLGGAFTCRYCRISFADRTMYLLHAGLHGQENPWQCNICSATCVDALDFAIHSLHR